MNPEPSATRATFPPDYGARGGEADDPLAWADVEARIRDAPNYWIATVAVDGRPHARPIDGVWVLGALCFGGSPDTRWVRNLEQNPAASVHLPSGDDVVILEGTAEYVDDAKHPLTRASTEANKVKYPHYFGGDEPRPFHPFWSLRPVTAYAWSLSEFPNRATRWTFNR